MKQIIEVLQLRAKQFAQSINEIRSDIIEIKENSLFQEKDLTGIKNIFNLHKKQTSEKIETVKQELVKSEAQIQEAITKHISSIRQPKDGEDAVVDYDAINKRIAREVSAIKLPEPDKVNYDLINETIDTTIKDEVSKIPKPKDGETPKVDYDKIVAEVKVPEEKILKELKQELNKNIPIGIQTIEFRNGYIIVILTDGKKYKHKIEIKNLSIFNSGGGGDIEKDIIYIKTITEDIDLKPQSITIIADCSNKDLQVKLPDPSRCFVEEHSFKISITRKDTNETTRVNIVPFNNELIVNKTSDYLLPTEVLNLITDGENWYLGA